MAEKKWKGQVKTKAAAEAKEALDRPKNGRPSAASTRITRPDEVRRRIQVVKLIDVLHKVAIEGATIDKERLNAIKILLSKTLPDLKSVEITGDGSAFNVTIVTNVERKLDK